jgi:hypothetical protein
MQKYCDESNQHEPMLQGLVESTPVNISMAAFLITRGPIAFIGSSNNESSLRGAQDGVWSDIFLLDAGEPTGLCREGPSGVFSRPWSKGTAKLNCNRWKAEVQFFSLKSDELSILPRSTLRTTRRRSIWYCISGMELDMEPGIIEPGHPDVRADCLPEGAQFGVACATRLDGGLFGRSQQWTGA